METRYDEKTNKLHIIVDLDTDPQESSTGASLFAYNSGGHALTTAKWRGKPLKVNLMATIPTGKKAIKRAA